YFSVYLLVSTLYSYYCHYVYYFFLNQTSAAQIYTLSLHDALPIFKPEIFVHRDSHHADKKSPASAIIGDNTPTPAHARFSLRRRSEEHTSELQSRENLVCRLLLEKKNKKEPIHSRSLSNLHRPIRY